MQRIDISYKTIIFTVSFLLGLYFLYMIRSVLILWFISFILMTALNPIVTFLEKYKVPRTLAIVISFILAITVISGVIAGILPTMIEQTTILAKNLTLQIPDSAWLMFDPTVFTSQLELISKNALSVLKLVIGAASNIFTIFSLIVFTFYLLTERKNFPKYLRHLFGRGDNEEHATELIDGIEKKLGGWVRGEIALMFIIGLFSYIGLTILGIPYSLPLALLAGLLELVPNIGPTISAIPAIIVAYTISPAIAIAVVVLYIVIQQLENNVIVPVVMRGALGIKPIVTLGALMVGVTIGGIGGAILAVPSYITLEIIVKQIYKFKHNSK